MGTTDSKDQKLIIDNFAGGGGASTGIERAVGRPIDIAINHDPLALAMHRANHPHTHHYCEDVFHVDPIEVCKGRSVGLLWLSPDCTYHSKARGGKPFRNPRKAKKRRGLANIANKWAKLVSPDLIILENVEEFQDWGPLTQDGKPCPARKGMSFRRWVRSLMNLGYKVEWAELRASNFGAPTIRKRLFLIARRDGLPIAWPKPTHGPGLLPYRTAAECIDWSVPCPSIFDRKRPLAEKTMKRIWTGIHRYLLNDRDPFIVKGNHTAENYNCFRGQGIHEPLQTVTQSPGFALVVPHIQRQYGNSVGHSAKEPNGTITAGGGGKSALVAAFLTEHSNGSSQRNFDFREPLRTQCAEVKGGHFAVVAPFLAKHYGGVVGTKINQSVGTVTTKDHHSLVNAFLINYYSNGSGKTGASLKKPVPTIPTRDRMGLVTIHGHDYQIVDIGMRMLQPRELFNAQGFPTDYIIDPVYNGKSFTKTAQVRMCGNSVCPPIAQALVEANFQNEERSKKNGA